MVWVAVSYKTLPPINEVDLNALRAYTATVPMTQYDVPEVSRRFRPHLPLHFAIQIAEK